MGFGLSVWLVGVFSSMREVRADDEKADHQVEALTDNPFQSGLEAGQLVQKVLPARELADAVDRDVYLRALVVSAKGWALSAAHGFIARRENSPCGRFFQSII